MNVVDRRLAFAAAGLMVFAGPVHAQTARSSLASAQALNADLFARDRNVSVRERSHPEYEALGLPLGAFTAYPKVEFSAEHNDNIFAVSTGEDSDVILRIKPEVSIESGWSRHALSAYARGAVNRYQDFDSEDTEDYGAGVFGRLDVSRATNLSSGVDWAHLTEPRTSSNAPASTREPVRFDQTQAFFALGHTVNRIKLGGRADFRQYDYDDGFTVGGAVIDQDNRDREVSSLTGRVDYALSPATALFVQFTGNTRDYTGPTTALVPARDSRGSEALVGANFEMGALMRGEIAAGYIQQDFDDVAYKDIDGFGARARVEWFPTELTTLTATASRTIEDSGIVGSGGYLSSSVGVQLDHELLRNVILTAQAGLSRDEYDGLDREDERKTASVGATYLLNRNLGVNAAYVWQEQDSKGAGAGSDFTVNRAMVSLVTQF